jgi:hypothetical protein
MAIVQVESPTIPDGKYLIRNRGGRDFYWIWKDFRGPLKRVQFSITEFREAEKCGYTEVNEHSPII